MKVRLGYFGRCVLRASHDDTNLRGCVWPERATNIGLSAVVDVSSSPNASARTRFDGHDRSEGATGRTGCLSW